MGIDVNLRGGRYGSVLICACCITYTCPIHGNAFHAGCMAGQSSIVQLLLQRGMSADEHGGIYTYHHAIIAAPLHQGSEQSDKKISRLVAREMKDLIGDSFTSGRCTL